MGITSVIGKVFKAVTSPLGVLENWANEPLKRWENNRQQQNADREVERRIREQTGVESVKSQLRREEAEHQASLEIKMQTDIARINAETEQWAKDEEFARNKELMEAAMKFRERSSELMTNIVKELGNMNLELREKAQNLILEKTREYEALQDEAQAKAEEEFVRIEEKFAGKGRVYDIMVTASEKKLIGVMDATAEFIANLKEDIKAMNQNIDLLTTSGHNHMNKMIDSFSSTMALPQADSNVKHIQGRISNDDIEDVQAEEVK
ncbi:MAG: hypothetical protein IIW58_02210 [Bacteroidales bacterium]|nr:hypothetical protein [Bacteroidales bacterium]